MSLFDKLGNLADPKRQAEMATAVSAVTAVVQSQGGLDAVVEKLKTGGLASIVSSWVATGANQPVTSNQIHDALGDDHVNQIANAAAMPKSALLSTLAQELPALVDAVTPAGSVPQGGLTNAALTLLRTHFQSSQS